MFSVPKMTLKDIRDEANRITDDIWDNADLNAWANQCLDDLTDVVKYEKTIMLNLEDSSREYELPEDFHDSVGLTNVYGAELEYSIEGNGTKLRVLSPFIGEAQFTYVAHLPKLVSPDDVPALPVPFQHIIAIYCAMKAMQMDEEEERMVAFMAQYEAGKGKLDRYIRRMRSNNRKLDWSVIR